MRIDFRQGGMAARFGGSGFAVGLDADTVAWLAAVRAVGSASLSTINAVDRFIRGMKNAGLWSKMLMVDLCVGNDLTSSLVRQKVPAGVARAYTNVNFVAGDFTERGANGGRKGDGTTKYLDTLCNPVALAWSATSLMLWQYFRETEAAGTSRISLGNAGASSASLTHLGWGSAGASEIVRVAMTSAVGAAENSARTGFIGGGTNGTTTVRFYRNGSTIGSNAAQNSTFFNGNMLCHTQNVNGTPDTNKATRRISTSLITQGLSSTEALALYNRVLAFETSLGRNV